MKLFKDLHYLPMSRSIFVPRFCESVGTLNLIRPSVCLSVCHKNFNLGHNFCTITDRALILGMCVPCDKTFPMVPCRDLDGDLWPASRSNLFAERGTTILWICLFPLGFIPPPPPPIHFVPWKLLNDLHYLPMSHIILVMLTSFFQSRSKMVT